MTLTKLVAVYSSILTLLGSSHALAKGDSRETARENCAYNGIKYDPASSGDKPGRANKIPDDFTGQVVCVDPSTKRVYEIFKLKKGLRDGESRKFDRDNGVLVEITPYRDGERHGCVEQYSEKTGKPTQSFCLEKGVSHGIQKDFDSATGKLKRIQFYSEKGGERYSGSSVSLNSKGQVTQIDCGKETLIGTDDLWCGRGGREGSVMLYTASGFPSEKRAYKNGKQHGKTEVFNNSGRLLEEVQYNAGKEVSRKEFGADGKLLSATLGAGIPGKSVLFFDGSKIPRLVTERDAKGIVREQQYYQNGKLVQEQIRVRPDGLYQVKTYSDRGVLSSEGEFVYETPTYWDGAWLVRHGKYRTFSENGKLESESEYTRGEREGAHKAYDPDTGEEVYSAQYHQGRLTQSLERDKKTGRVLRREYAPDGSIKREVAVGGRRMT